jgi:hypothetical protein
MIQQVHAKPVDSFMCVCEMVILVAEPQTEPATWQAESTSPVSRTAACH